MLRYVLRAPRAAHVAKAKRPERGANRAARRRLVRELGPQWTNVSDGFRVQIDLGRLSAAIGARQLDLDRLLDGYYERSRSFLARTYRQAIDSGAELGARYSGAAGAAGEIRGIRLAAADWIERVGARRITRINAATREGVRGILADVLRSDASPTRAAQDIGRLVGLTRAQARSVRAFEANLLERRIPTPLADTQFVRESIAQDVERFRDRLLRARGQLIVDTEGQAAIQAGERMWWQAAAQEAPDVVQLEGVIKQWHTVDDDHVCPVCDPLHEVELPFAENFESLDWTGEGPPAHPGCRCWLTYRQEESA